VNQIRAGQIKECCEQPENRVVIEQRDSVVVEQCKVCGCKHHTLYADPIVIGVAGTPV